MSRTAMPRFSGWLVPLVLAALLWPPPVGAADGVIVIGATRLDPPVLRTVTEQRVTFVNRSGRIVHVDFLGEAGQHHVYEVPKSIWAIFHRRGRHPYVVHFETGGGRELRGVVEVEVGPVPGPPPPTCTGFTVMGDCLAP